MAPLFRLVAASLYASEHERTYAYLPGGAAEELPFAEIWARKGTLLYLHRNAGDERRLLEQIVEIMPTRRPAALWLDNSGGNHRHWRQRTLYVGAASAILLGGFRLSLPSDATANVGGDKVIFSAFALGIGGRRAKGPLTLHWTGYFTGEAALDDLGEAQAAITYSVDGYDEVTGQNLLLETSASALAAPGVRAKFLFDPHDPPRCAITLPESAPLTWSGLPPMRAKSIRLIFARRGASYRLTPDGTAVCVQDGPFCQSPHGYFAARRGDPIRFLPGGSTRPGHPDSSSSTAYIGSTAPYIMGNSAVRVDPQVGIPLLPTSCEALEGPLLRAIRENAQDARNRLTFQETLAVKKEAFPYAQRGDEILWLRIAETNTEVPGLAMCHVDPALALCAAAPDAFIVLCRDNARFQTPYSLTRRRIGEAVENGYPTGDARRLALAYPNGLTCLSRRAFLRAVEDAGSALTGALLAACDTFTIDAAEYRFLLNPEYWPGAGAVMVLKADTGTSLIELSRDAERWSFPPESPAAALAVIENAYAAARGSAAEAVFIDSEWRGSVALMCPSREGVTARCIALPAGETSPVVLL